MAEWSNAAPLKRASPDSDIVGSNPTVDYPFSKNSQKRVRKRLASKTNPDQLPCVTMALTAAPGRRPKPAHFFQTHNTTTTHKHKTQTSHLIKLVLNQTLMFHVEHYNCSTWNDNSSSQSRSSFFSANKKCRSCLSACTKHAVACIFSFG